MRGATAALSYDHEQIPISIHAPHAGSDLTQMAKASRTRISIHAPHAGSDSYSCIERNERMDFNPRSPCGERPWPKCATPLFCNFNPRSPCGERPQFNGATGISGKFQSTLPMRGATDKTVKFKAGGKISIHAPHAGSDNLLPCRAAPMCYFNPRSPCGERQRQCAELPTVS